MASACEMPAATLQRLEKCNCRGCTLLRTLSCLSTPSGCKARSSTEKAAAVGFVRTEAPTLGYSRVELGKGNGHVKAAARVDRGWGQVQRVGGPSIEIQCFQPCWHTQSNMHLSGGMLVYFRVCRRARADKFE